MAKILTFVVDVPSNTLRWYIHKNRELDFTLGKQLAELMKEKNCQTQITTTSLPNGKTRFTSVHKWNTQADLDAYLAILAPYAGERNAYNTANNIDYSETVTEE